MGNAVSTMDTPTEHYRYVKDSDNGCNGYKGLLEFYERLES